MDDHRLRVGPSDFARVDPHQLAERAGARGQADGARVTTVGGRVFETPFTARGSCSGNIPEL